MFSEHLSHRVYVHQLGTRHQRSNIQVWTIQLPAHLLNLQDSLSKPEKYFSVMIHAIRHALLLEGKALANEVLGLDEGQ